MLCDLGLENFDTTRVGYASAKAAFAEVRHLGRLDPQVRSTRLRRPEPLTVQITITVHASSAREAAELATTILRSAVHATGGNTAGWNELMAVVVAAPRPPGRRARRTRSAGPTSPGARFPSWDACSAAARARSASVAPLPPIHDTGPAHELIDLR